MCVGDERENFLQLPLPERTMAVALKHIFDQIKKIDQEEQQEIHQVQQSFIDRFKEVQVRASAIIKGSPIVAQELKQRQKFLGGDGGQVDKLAQNNKHIEGYWLTVLLNFFRQDLSAADKQLGAAIVDISTNVSEDGLELIFEIGQNDWVTQGKFARRFWMQEELPMKTEGDKVTWLKPKPDGLLRKILSDSENQDELGAVFHLANEIINEMVPYSLQFFLGAVEDEEQDAEDEEDDEEESMSQENGASKE